MLADRGEYCKILSTIKDRIDRFKISKSHKDKKGGGEYKGMKRGHIYTLRWRVFTIKSVQR